MSFAFPAFPAANATYKAPNGVTYIWDGTKWVGQAAQSKFVSKSGDTMTGPLIVPGGASGNQVPIASEVPKVFVSDTAPATKKVGDIWYDNAASGTARAYIWNSSAWVDLSP
jgi:hypothetical protein